MAENLETSEKRVVGEDSQVEDTANGTGTGRAVLVDRLWKIVITGVLFCLLFREELAVLRDRWKDPKESHGLLIPAFSLYFIYQERRRLSKAVGKSSFWGLALMGLSLWGYLFSFFKGFAYPKPMMMVVMLLGIVLFQGGWRILRLWPPPV